MIPDEEAIFHVARQIKDPETRRMYLEQICAGDSEQKERIQSLLEADEEDETLLKSHPVDFASQAQPISARSGQHVGRYRLLQRIGEGGFGVVYMAEQSQPVRRKVALKIIKPGMDTRAVVARFEAERQALAMMDHANIAKVYDGGTTDNGRPYFVMELVKGVPITEYCDKNQLSTEDRLRLFETVCRAVQHAHQKGIIHRDLKPSNVLVTLADGKPVAKVIDFGVAKATTQRLTEKTLFTAFGQMVGTPQYMSPEQAEMSCLDVDTRSDVYSLGVILYELLTGTTPLEADRLRTAGYAEMQRLIQEDEPPKPSTRLSTTGEQLTIIAKHRSVAPERLKRQIQGDLDWIVMKALEKDRSRRYESTSAFANDIQRHLRSDMVVARPPTIGYRVKKYLARNRAQVAVASSLLAVLLLGLIGTSLALKQLSGTVKELHSLIIEKALTQAVYGDMAGLDSTIELANRANLPDDWVDTMRGLAAFQRGENSTARELLEHAIAVEPHNVSANALYSWVLFHTGDLESWSHHAEKLKSMESRTSWEDFDEFFLGFSEFYVNYDSAAKRFDTTADKHPTWMFARLMRANAHAHDAWVNQDPHQSRDALNQLEAISQFLPDSDFVNSTSLFILSAALWCDPDASDWKSIATSGEEMANKVARHPDYTIGTWCRLKYWELVCNGEEQQRARDDMRRFGRGFPLAATVFEEDFSVGQDHEIFDSTDGSNEFKLVEAMVHAWAGRTAEANDIVGKLEETSQSWAIRHRILWVYLLSKDYGSAAERCSRWANDQGGSRREQLGDADTMEVIARGLTAEDVDLRSKSIVEQLQLEFLFGLIAYSKSEQATALEHFKRAAESFDDWEVTRYANALRLRLQRDMSDSQISPDE